MKKVRDYYFKKAKEEEYAARSVYKLKEIDERYRILKQGIKVLDIGCSPGSWSQYMLKKIGSGKILGIDLRNDIHIKDKRFCFLKGDILTIEEDLWKGYEKSFDLITSDAAPSTSGDKFSDGQKSLQIVQAVFQIAKRVLKSEGSLIAKVFQGEDLKSFVDSVKPDFAMVFLFKPKSSRKESREIFIIAHRGRQKE
jgi:23S rRNA (uridine2552-2'-O)-methyltransferase